MIFTVSKSWFERKRDKITKYVFKITFRRRCVYAYHYSLITCFSNFLRRKKVVGTLRYSLICPQAFFFLNVVFICIIIVHINSFIKVCMVEDDCVYMNSIVKVIIFFPSYNGLQFLSRLAETNFQLAYYYFFLPNIL